MPRKMDAMIGTMADAFRLPADRQDALRVELVRESLDHHYGACAYYRALCESARFAPEDLRTAADLDRVPMIPVKTFKSPKSHALLSVPLTSVDLEIRSTGTSGVPSVARRDGLTTTRVGLALLGLYREFFGLSNGCGLFLCPSTAESPEMGLVKVYNLFCGILDDRAYLVKDYSFRAEEAVAYLKKWANKMTRHVFGPPFLINRLLKYMEAEDVRLKLDPGSFVITLGGWKRFNGENIGREAFDAKLEKLLGIRPENVRDMYGLIETNMLAIECAHHKKHVPPWCHVSIRDVDDLTRSVPLGKTGAIAILDPLCHSYPAYVQTEDIGAIEQVGECACGRVGPTLVFHRRIQGAELGCCAVSIEQFIEMQESAGTAAGG